MESVHLTIDIQSEHVTIAQVEVPIRITVGEPTSDVIPLHADTDDLKARLKRGVEAFRAAVQ